MARMGASIFGFPSVSGSLKGVLPLLAPAWVSLMACGVLLNAVLRYKSRLPKPLTDLMEYGKLRTGSRDSGLPKR